jgi:sugar/nucleoside kinase (ribokinase family)
MSVVVVGDVVTDIHAVHSGPLVVGSDTPASIRVTGGGSAANTAAWLAATGTPVQLVAVVGLDVAGDDRLAELTAAGVGTAHMRRSGDAPTGSVIVLVRDGERSFLTDRGANLLLVPSDVDSALDALAATARHLHLSGYVLLDGYSRPAGLRALAAARERGLTVSVDMASAEPLRRAGPSTVLDWLRGSDLLFANLDEARVLADRSDPVALAMALSSHARTAVVKLGAVGAVWASSAGVVEVPALPVPLMADPTGAGDAFAAGVVSAWLSGSSPGECLEAGARLGAAAVGVVGGRPAINPDR